MDSQLLINALSQIDYVSLLHSLAPITMGFVANRITNEIINMHKYKLVKNPMPFNIKKVTIPPEVILRTNNIDNDLILSNVLYDRIKEFTTVITNSFDNSDLKLFYNNINNLKVKKMLIPKKTVSGYYNSFNNHIRIRNDHFFGSTIYHELFHMASSLHANNKNYSGFSQGNILTLSSIGNGLNEGYTQLMTERYFQVLEDEKIYRYESFVASSLDKIIGKEKMENMYLNANLYGFIQELKKYELEENIMQFISNLDAYNSRNDLGDLKKDSNKSIIEKHMRNINRFLCSCYFRKVGMQIEEGEIDSNEFSYLIKDFGISVIEYSYFYDSSNDTIYKNLFSVDAYHELLQEVFSEYLKIVNDREEDSTMRR